MTDPTRDNAAVLFLDLQAEIVKNARTLPVKQLKSNAKSLAKLAALHHLPSFLSAVPPGGKYLAEVLDPLGDPTPRERTQTTAFADAGLVAALAASGRRVVVLAGVATEIVVLRTALDALAAGDAVHVLVDVCGGVDARSEDAAWRRIVAAGGTTSSLTTLAAELAGDFTTDVGQKTLAIAYETMAAAG